MDYSEKSILNVAMRRIRKLMPTHTRNGSFGASKNRVLNR